MIYQCTRCCAQFPLPPRKCPACFCRTFGTLPEQEPPATVPSRRSLQHDRLSADVRPEVGGPIWGDVSHEALSDDARPAAAAAAADVVGPGDDAQSFERWPHVLDALNEVGGIKCGEQGCPKTATHKFFWPSPDEPPTRFACEEHAQRAAEISKTLGFEADPQPL